MKTIGLIGGMSWESTVPYYTILNEVVRERLGGLHSAKIVLYSVDFFDIERLQRSGDWDGAGRAMADAARAVYAAGAEGLVLGTNTMHKVASYMEAAVPIPLLHIADLTAAAVRAAGIRKVGLLGTRFTMEEGFYKDRLRERHGLEVLVPGAEDRAEADRIIFDELCAGQVLETSRAAYRRIIAGLVRAGAEGVILGCTEIGLLVDPAGSDTPLFDTTLLHARAAATWALEGAGAAS